MSEQKLPVVPKFRVWLPDPDVEKMLRVKALIFENDKTRCMCGYAYDFYLEDEDATIMQSTGLLDKNGKEIFEGDIVSIDTDEFDSLFVKYETGIYWLMDNEECVEHLSDYYKYASVIGNIYENPELLGQ